MIAARCRHGRRQAPAAAADKSRAAEEKQRKLIAVLQSDAPPQDKAITCKQLAIYGTKDAVPALAALLADEQLASWARIALEAIPDPAADEALREAMGKLQGRLLVGVINSIGVRRDAKAVDGLVGRLKDADAEVASAAAVALGRIGGAAAAKALEQSLAERAGRGPLGGRRGLHPVRGEAPRRRQSGRGREAVRPGPQGRRAQAAGPRSDPRGDPRPAGGTACRCWSSNLQSADKALFGHRPAHVPASFPAAK